MRVARAAAPRQRRRTPAEVALAQAGSAPRQRRRTGDSKDPLRVLFSDGRGRLLAVAALAVVGGLAGVAGGAPATAVRAVAGAPPAPVADPFVENRAGVVVDWRRGTIAVTAGAAADLRMPSAEIARPRAERRAQAIARARVADVLRTLPLGGGRHLDSVAVDRALGRARATTVETESNGGAILRLELSFGDWAEQPLVAGTPAPPAIEPPPLALWLPQGRLAAAPIVVVGGKEIALACATFTTAAGLPSGVRPITVRADAQGRLLVEQGATVRELSGRRAMIYVQKIVR